MDSQHYANGTIVYRIGDGSRVMLKHLDSTSTIYLYDAMTEHEHTFEYPDSNVASDFALASAQLLDRGYKLIGGAQ